ncbi:MAG: PDZ domain-containing protein [Opitutales bacterium]
MRLLILSVLPALLLAEEGRRRPEVEAAIARMASTIVRIEVISEEGEAGRMRRDHSVGSGSIIDTQGHVLTNYHVAGRGATFLCRLADREEVPATLVGADAMTDLAVIRLDLSRRRSTTPLPVATFADSSKVRPGDTVLSMGCPAGLNQSVTLGIVANDQMVMTRFVGGMDLDGESVGDLVRWIGHDAVIFGGNSGGPLVDAEGRIVGVNEIGVGSLGGAIPANTARAVAEELIRHGKVVRSWTGIEARPLLRSQAGSRGVLVGAVLPVSPAERAGIKSGDILLSLDGKPVHADCAELMPDFHRAECGLPIGKEVAVDLLRDGKALTLRLTALEREPRVAREVALATWGTTLRDLTTLSALSLRRPEKSGVLVHSRREGGPAATAKPEILDGDLIVSVAGHPITNLAELRARSREALGTSSVPVPVLIGIRRGEAELLSVARLGPEPDPEPAPRVAKAWAGLSTQVLTPELAKALGVSARSGVRVTQVLPGSGAADAGVRVGDVILKLDGKVVASRRQEDAEGFGSTLREYPVDATVELELLRDAKPLTLKMALRERPAPASELPSVRDQRLGFTARALGFDDRVDRGLPEGAQGAVVTKVERSSWADLAGLRASDILVSVNAKPVTDNLSLRSALDGLFSERPRHVVLRIQRGVSGTFLEFEPDWAALEESSVK